MAAGRFHALLASFAGLGVDRRCYWRTGGVEVDATALGFGPDSLGLTFPFPCSGAQISSTALQFGPLVSNSRLYT